MNVKLFYDTHGRFPSQHEFKMLKEQTLAQQNLRQQQPSAPEESVESQWISAARTGDLATLKRLRPQMRSVDEPINNVTALAVAAQGNHASCVEFLIDNGAAVDRRTPQGRSPLLYAAESGHFELMTYLINRGATHFTYTDQQCESYFVSYVIRQSITRRDVSRALQDNTVTAMVLEYLSLGGLKVRPIERLSAHVLPNTRKKPAPRPKPAAAAAVNAGGNANVAAGAGGAGAAASPAGEGAGDGAAAGAGPEVEGEGDDGRDGADSRSASPELHEEGDEADAAQRQKDLDEAIAAERN